MYCRLHCSLPSGLYKSNGNVIRALKQLRRLPLAILALLGSPPYAHCSQQHAALVLPPCVRSCLALMRLHWMGGNTSPIVAQTGP